MSAWRCAGPLILLASLSMQLPAAVPELPPRVHADDRVVIRAGISGHEGETLYFGDVLRLVVRVESANGRARLPAPEAQWFTAAWPQTGGPYLLDYRQLPSPPDVWQVEYRFQILACPEGEIVCRGARVYPLPEFELEIGLPAAEDGETPPQRVSFRPWPEEIVVASAIPLTGDGELFGFYQYFPTSAWPRPWSGHDQQGTAAGLLAGGLVFLLGGIVMSPFGFFRRKTTGGVSISRWEKVYRQLQAGEFTEEDRFLDALRRSLIWYCVDELDVDPFVWLKRPEEVTGYDEEEVRSMADFRTLFIDLLHSPRGKGDELLGRFSSLVAHAR